MTAPIGIFDSGYGGLTILEKIRHRLPQYSYIYLGDNARTPYGTRSFDVVYHYTLQCVEHLFDMGCRLVILACNTASAKALRTIQQHDLPRIDSRRRVLGVIRPTVEAIGTITTSRHVGLLVTTSMRCSKATRSSTPSYSDARTTRCSSTKSGASPPSACDLSHKANWWPTAWPTTCVATPR